MEKLLSFINYSYDGYPKRINDIRNIGNTPADWHKLKKQYNQKAIKYVSSEEVVKFYKSLIDIYCFQEAYPNMYYNYSNSLNYSSYISELNTLLLGCPELINFHTISYISSLDISETKIKLGQKDETLDKISRSFFDIAEFQILYSNSMSNGDALEKMNAE